MDLLVLGIAWRIACDLGDVHSAAYLFRRLAMKTDLVATPGGTDPK